MEIPRQSRGGIEPRMGVAWLVLSGALLFGCGDEPIEVENRSARLTSVGPIEPRDRFVDIQYTIRDREGDDQNVIVEVCPANRADAETCPTPVRGLGGDGTNQLPTVPEGTDVPHRLAWHVGCGLIDGDQCLRADLQTEYVARVRLEGSNTTRTSSPFELGEDLKLDEVPTCNPQVVDVPAPCQPEDGSRQ